MNQLQKTDFEIFYCLKISHIKFSHFLPPILIPQSFPSPPGALLLNNPPFQIDIFSLCGPLGLIRVYAYVWVGEGVIF